MAKTILVFLFLAALAHSQVPHTFDSGSVAKASEVNENFTFLMGRIDSLKNENTILKAQIDTLKNTALLPIGTVIATMVQMDTVNGIWVLADGRAGTTEYFQATGNANVPDLRGMFLRGLNVGRADGKQDPDGAGRAAGSYQPDSLKSHAHAISAWYNTGTQNGWCIEVGEHPFEYNNYPTLAVGGLETRSRNSAVFWYVKVK
jgi:hypothetical protein